MTMAQKSTPLNGRYVYAIISRAAEVDHALVGIDARPVYAATQGDISALVSDVPNQRIRPQRRNLAAHQGVLKKLMEQTTPLPVAFGIIADGPAAVSRILRENQEEFAAQLSRVAGKMEMGLRVSWDVPNIFEYFIQTHPELRSARDRYFGANREPSQEEKLELGRLFDRILQEEREDHTQQVEDKLGPYCFEIKANTCSHEYDVMRLACLIGREYETQFEKGVFEAAGLFDNNFAFDYNGPWAPHNFTDLQLTL